MDTNKVIEKLLELQTEVVMLTQEKVALESKVHELADDIEALDRMDEIQRNSIDKLNEQLDNRTVEADELRKLLEEANKKLEKKCACKKK